jgi:ribonuclease HI/probable phosphoglycerate mutase
LILYCDGASRGNPGPSSYGWTLVDDSGKCVREAGKRLPEGTNNVAEYEAMVAGLTAACELGIKQVVVRADSELVIRQVTGRYKVKSPGLLPLYQKVLELSGRFDRISFEHVPREQNKRADALANMALDQPTSSR